MIGYIVGQEIGVQSSSPSHTHCPLGLWSNDHQPFPYNEEKGKMDSKGPASLNILDESF